MIPVFRSARAIPHNWPNWLWTSRPAKSRMWLKLRTSLRWHLLEGRAAYGAGARGLKNYRKSNALQLPRMPLLPVGARIVADLATDEKKNKIKSLSNAIGEERDCDVMILNYSFEPNFEVGRFLPFLKTRKTRRPNILVFVTSEGGNADCAYRVGRYMQDAYRSITVVVAGWCKSAGTLLCIAANDLVVTDAGELGPLDVQLSKLDEVGERSSGLAVEAAFEKLQKEYFQAFHALFADHFDRNARSYFI